jgi:chaperonin GroES
MILKEDDVIGVLKGGDDISALSPLQDRILIEVEEAKDTTSGGLLLTEASKDKPTIGKVVAVGPGRAGDDEKIVAPTVAVGSSVLYQKFSGSEFEGINGKSYIVVRDMDILAVVA